MNDISLRLVNVMKKTSLDITTLSGNISLVTDPRKRFKIGVSFSTANRRIEDWKVAE